MRPLRAVPHRRGHPASSNSRCWSKAKATSESMDRVRGLVESIDDSAWCGIANTIRDPILALLDLAEDHFADHAAGADLRAAHHSRLGDGSLPLHLPVDSRHPLAYIFQGLEEHPHLATTHRQARQPAAGHHRAHLPASLRDQLQPGAHRASPSPSTTSSAGAPTGPRVWPTTTAPPAAWSSRPAGLIRRRWPPQRWPGGLIVGGPHEISELVTVQQSQRPLGRPGGPLAGAAEGAPAAPACRRACRGRRRPSRRRWPSSAPGRRDSPPPTTWPAWATRRSSSKTCPCRAAWCTWASPSIACPATSSAAKTELIEQEGVEIRYNTRLGRDIHFADLEK